MNKNKRKSNFIDSEYRQVDKICCNALISLVYQHYSKEQQISQAILVLYKKKILFFPHRKIAASLTIFFSWGQMPLFCRKILFQTSEKIKVSHSGNPSCNRIFKSNHQVRCTIRSTIEEVWIFVLMINLSFAWYQSEFLVTDYSCLIRADNKKHTLSLFFFYFFYLQS